MGDDLQPILYFDLASPYSYLAVMRAKAVLGCEPVLQPVLAGAIFAHRGWGSWALTPQREANMHEIERRAAAYSLPLSWPHGWPPNSLAAQRAAIFAQRRGLLRQFAQAVYLDTYGHGEPLQEHTVFAAAKRVGLDHAKLAAALGDQAIKAALRQATEEAIGRGVNGVPTLRLDEELYFGDDKLELVAAALS